jgi:nucleotide-binding universal stress UspA family protein
VNINRVVVGVDGSPGSARAIDWVAALVAGADIEVYAVHVLTYTAEFRRDLFLDTMRTWRRELQASLAGPWTAALRASDDTRPITAHVIEAESVTGGLMELAATVGANLIVVGTQGHGAVAERILGGTGYRLAHRSRTPVVIVPHDWEATAA